MCSVCFCVLFTARVDSNSKADKAMPATTMSRVSASQLVSLASASNEGREQGTGSCSKKEDGRTATE